MSNRGVSIGTISLTAFTALVGLLAVGANIAGRTDEVSLLSIIVLLLSFISVVANYYAFTKHTRGSKRENNDTHQEEVLKAFNKTREEDYAMRRKASTKVGYVLKGFEEIQDTTKNTKKSVVSNDTMSDIDEIMNMSIISPSTAYFLLTEKIEQYLIIKIKSSKKLFSGDLTSLPFEESGKLLGLPSSLVETYLSLWDIRNDIVRQDIEFDPTQYQTLIHTGIEVLKFISTFEVKLNQRIHSKHPS